MENGANQEQEDPRTRDVADQPAGPETGDTAEETEYVTEREAELAAEAANLKERLLRALAENENLRKRMDREKQDASRYAVTGFAKDILTVADNMARAISSIPDRLVDDRDSHGLVQGIKMTEKEILAVFERNGIKKIDPMGEKFDSHVHQAMLEIETGDHAPGTVAQVLMPGYTIHDRLLRPAMVGVAKAAAGAAAAAEDEAETDGKAE